MSVSSDELSKRAKKASKKYKEQLEVPPKVSASELMLDHDFKGTLSKQGGSIKTWHERLCILHQGKLYYYASSKDTKPKGMINVQGLTCQAAEVNLKKKFGIKIISPHRTYYFACDTENDQDRWIKEINNSSARNSDYQSHVVDCDNEADVKHHDIQSAIDYAKDGDHVILRAGIYIVNETILVKKSITIRGVYPDSTLVTILGQECVSKPIFKIDTFNENLTVQLKNDIVSFQHLTITNQAKDSILLQENVSCVEILSGKCNFNEVCINGSRGCGIEVKNRLFEKLSLLSENNSTSTNNNATSTNNNNFVKPKGYQSSECTLTSCTIEDNKFHGIKFQHDTTGDIKKCIFQRNEGYGIYCTDESLLKIEKNVFSDCKKGAIYVDTSKSITIEFNKMHNNGNQGKDHIRQSTRAAPTITQKNDFL
ncbi:hypothetical protein ABK040_016720 [Willaertia magna]